MLPASPQQPSNLSFHANQLSELPGITTRCRFQIVFLSHALSTAAPAAALGGIAHDELRPGQDLNSCFMLASWITPLVSMFASYLCTVRTSMKRWALPWLAGHRRCCSDKPVHCLLPAILGDLKSRQLLLVMMIKTLWKHLSNKTHVQETKEVAAIHKTLHSAKEAQPRQGHKMKGRQVNRSSSLVLACTVLSHKTRC